MTFKLMLAPIEDMTSAAFRAVCYKYGADLTFTELIRVAGLAHGDPNTWARIELKDETPTVIQLLGSKEIYFKKFLSEFKPSKGFAGFNLNIGCPSPDVIKLGQGCAMVRRISKVRKIVQIFKEAGYPISIKMRLGMNQMDKENKVYLHLIDGVDADFFIVHARHALQGYNEPADFGVYAECVATGKKIVANGDIHTKEQIEELEKIGVIGAMIGRPAILEPTIFNRLKGVAVGDKETALKEFTVLSEKYNEPFRYRKNVDKHFRNETTIFQKG